MDLKEALTILHKNHTSTWEGVLAITSSKVELTTEIYEAWKIVREYLNAEKAKEPKPEYPMTEFRKAIQNTPAKTLMETFQVSPGIIKRWKSGQSAPHPSLQKMIIKELKEKNI
jgi:hypothetical protein